MTGADEQWQRDVARHMDWIDSWAGWDHLPNPPEDVPGGYNFLHHQYGGMGVESVPFPASKLDWGVPHRYFSDDELAEGAARWGDAWGTEQ